MLCEASQGFVYAVTMTGTTGKSVAVPDDVLAYMDRVRAVSPVPVCAGFGIRGASRSRACRDTWTAWSSARRSSRCSSAAKIRRRSCRGPPALTAHRRVFLRLCATARIPGSPPRRARSAREIARRGWTLVYGGGSVGLMGILADAALAAGGRVVGVIPRFLYEREVGHDGLTELEIVATLTERKVRMGELSDGFLSLPGGIGTMDELFEALSWAQLGLEAKPNGLLNVNGYYDDLVAFLDRAVASVS